ncbi:hypothetical protein CVT25_012467 [Psilocybe cyanescens]|uniref:Uncharacterized protein n=1 Tax=Psilocybe cyanescens TaxID=93625 RepID=A0A409XHD0_PSICY|nr:hypothetical protein CVT25_012467 [Psilocybe cyanescens]
MTTQHKSSIPSSLVAFPSVSSSLHSLPQATSMQNVSLHPNSNALRAAESEAKLQKALSKTSSSFTPQVQPMMYRTSPLPASQDPSGGLMMRTKSKFST